jgi:hypothetical protein
MVLQSNIIISAAICSFMTISVYFRKLSIPTFGIYTHTQLLYLLGENFPSQLEIPVFLNGKSLADIHIGEKLTELLPAIIPAH